MPPAPGILWVTSHILTPSKLSEEAFDDWYENDHALEVLALPGVPSAVKYKAHNQKNLIVYELPSLSYTTSPAFLAVANQTPPEEAVHRIYKNASFDIRFYAELPSPSPSPSPSLTTHNPRAKLACIQLTPLQGQDTAFLSWFAKELAEGLAGVKGFVGMRRFELKGGVVREGNVNVEREQGKGRYLVLVVFEDDGEGVRKEVEGWVNEGKLGTGEVGWFGVRRVWEEGEVEAP